jgi:prepilin-type N-terminal cleavage/methylation domain-containing protein
MPRYTARSPHCRTGFTLVEMLVVLVLILVLAGIAILIAPKVNERRKPANGAGQLQQALLMAKQRAFRDQAPRGVRIQPIPIIQVSTTRINQTGVPVQVQAQLSGVTPTFPPLPGNATPDQQQQRAELLRQFPVGLPWQIQPGSVLVVYDTDPLAQSDQELYSNLEVVTVQATPNANTFTASFQRTHTTQQTRFKLLAYAQELQFVEQPDDYFVRPPEVGDTNPTRFRRVFVPGPAAPVIAWNPNAAPPTGTYPQKTVVLEQLQPRSQSMPPAKPWPGDFSGGLYFLGTAANAPPRNNELWPVQSGDSIEIRGGGPMRSILALTRRPGFGSFVSGQQFEADVLVVDDGNANPGGFPNPIPPTRDYRIVRAPRVQQSEPPVKLPNDVAIDLNAVNRAWYAQVPYAAPLPIDPVTGTIDIVFSPAGGVVSRGVGSDQVELWIRDVTLDTVVAGSAPPRVTQYEQAVVVTYTRTGFIAAFPVDTTPNAAGNSYASPYSQVRTGAHATGL